MIKAEEIKEDRRGLVTGFIHYSVAKRENLRKGSQFTVELIEGRTDLTTTFEVGEYINYRNDINRPFSGFEVKELKK